ncbi:MAG: oligopeptide transport system substrate-binding protein [Acidobacteriota bacterium]|nr:oligopeptide transport system substrate-binding protein [Acidobacteriota bacterium]
MSNSIALKRKRQLARWRTRVAATLLVVMALSSGCFLDHEVEPYYGRAVVPRAQEFRWSDGGLPQVFDPALAAVPPDTDAVRAMYEGLTEYDPKSLAPVPGVASRWESTADGREWTFYLRRDARWSNNDVVTAHDFVRSWQRTLQIGERAPHARLLKNIQGAQPVEVVPPATQPSPEAQAQAPREPNGKEEAKKEVRQEPQPQPKFGAEAIDDYTLRVRLIQPDPNFPALVSHPVFRPIHKLDESSANSETVATSQRLVSNGAFQLSKVGGDGVVLERAKNYWDAQAVALQRVQFVPAQDAEAALASYRAGDVDAVTNAGFEPLALKLLAPYKDFRRATFGALTYYSFNAARTPFDDVRVREALAIAIDRDRISEDELGGATEPAKKFLPAQMTPASDAEDHAQASLIERDVDRARKLLAEAGFPEGKNFPKIRLLVNRNAQQRQVAEAVAAMWHSTLNVETEIIQKDWNEYEIAYRSGDYDVARRSYVMQTADESSSLREMLEPDSVPVKPATQIEQAGATGEKNGKENPEEGVKGNEKQAVASPAAPPQNLTEAQAMRELHAMPIYFASSYALVKPYVAGFETNLLDAPSLKHVRIDTSWQQPKQAAMIWFKSGE